MNRSTVYQNWTLLEEISNWRFIYLQELLIEDHGYFNNLLLFWYVSNFRPWCHDFAFAEMPSFLHLNANKHLHCFNRTLPKMSGSVHEGVKEERGKSNKKAAVASPLSCTYRCSNLIRHTFTFCEKICSVDTYESVNCQFLFTFSIYGFITNHLEISIFIKGKNDGKLANLRTLNLNQDDPRIKMIL